MNRDWKSERGRGEREIDRRGARAMNSSAFGLRKEEMEINKDGGNAENWKEVWGRKSRLCPNDKKIEEKYQKEKKKRDKERREDCRDRQKTRRGGKEGSARVNTRK